MRNVQLQKYLTGSGSDIPIIFIAVVEPIHDHKT